MAQPDSTQLNVRSQFARQRAASIARETGMTVTQVVEEALRAYQPAGKALAGRHLVRKGPILVMPKDDKAVSAQEADAALDELRGGAR